MTTAATFVASIPSPSQGVWHLGPFPLRAYALCIVLGIVAASVVTERRMRQRGAPPYAVLDIAVWAVPFGIVGARIYHVITSADQYFSAGAHPVEALYIWNGGLGIWGGVAGGGLGAWIAARKLGLPLSFVADALAPGLPLAQAIGRWGNWFNQELFGRPTSLPWGLSIDQAHRPPGFYNDATFHPTFLYESLWCLGVAVLVWQLDRRYRFGRGRAFAIYVMAYCVGRFWIESLRIDGAEGVNGPSTYAQHFFGLRLNGWTSIVVFLGALIYFLRVRGPQQRVTFDEEGTVRVLADGEEAGAAAPEADTDTEADSVAGESDAAPVAESRPGTS